MKVIVVTGGIGSGKSSACRFLEKEYGWPVYYADGKVKELYAKSPDLLDRIEKALESRFRDENGVFVPSLLAAVIFSDKTALDKVESLVFPELISDFGQWKTEHDSKYVILESATILEKPSLKGVGDITVLVDAPLGVRAARAAARDSVSETEIIRRMSQQPLMNSLSLIGEYPDVDVVIINDSTEDELQEKLRKMAKNLL